MSIDLSAKARGIIYALLSIGSIVATYLGAKQILGPEEIALWTGLSSFGFAFAKLNTPSPGDSDEGDYEPRHLLND